ncbi:abortive infection family protein [Bartonella sp. A05]|uniref:abortive infection family protein n=1 Tax=Bartonella sp. A05 TaxID=2967261 RepID=UPI0022A94373|nr:abortive infection family protein [Bartonella sp. A05]MCZ2204380.1 abortive infection family protein [Bartonella sp. A05]
MTRKIPIPIIELLANHMFNCESHDDIDMILRDAGACGNPPSDYKNKADKVLKWLKYTNEHHNRPLDVLGGIISFYENVLQVKRIKMSKKYYISDTQKFRRNQHRNRKKLKLALEDALGQYGLVYQQGRIVSTRPSSGFLSGNELEEIICCKNIPSVHEEFQRALKKVDSEPLEAVSAASNIIESICKTYIEKKELQLPSSQSLISLWGVISKHFKFDPKSVQEDSLKKIISGMFSVVNGIATLRNSGSSAHGQGIRRYKPEPREARFAVNAAHSLALFILETWDERDKQENSAKSLGETEEK